MLSARLKSSVGPLEMIVAMNQIHHRGNRERILYTWVAVLVPTFVLIGFAPTYYLR